MTHMRRFAAVTAVLFSLAGAGSAHAADDVEMTKRQMAGFVADVGSMDGAVSICDQHEAELIEQCASLLLKDWSLYTGQAQVRDTDFLRALSKSWAANKENAARIQRDDRPKACSDVVPESRKSKIWEICRHPGGAAPPQFSAPTQLGTPPSSSPSGSFRMQ